MPPDAVGRARRHSYLRVVTIPVYVSDPDAIAAAVTGLDLQDGDLLRIEQQWPLTDRDIRAAWDIAQTVQAAVPDGVRVVCEQAWSGGSDATT